MERGNRHDRDGSATAPREGAEVDATVGKRSLTDELGDVGHPAPEPVGRPPYTWTAPTVVVDEGTARAHGLIQFDPSAAPARGHPDQIHRVAEAGLAGAGGTLPHLDTIQRSFGHHDVRDVVSHVGGPAAAAAEGLNARAYASGDHVAFGETPDLHLAAHEAAHVVQQRAGVQLAGGIGEAGDRHEQHADAVADLVVRGASAERLLDELAHRGPGGGAAVQRGDRDGAAATGVQQLNGLLLDPATDAAQLAAVVRAHPGEWERLIETVRRRRGDEVADAVVRAAPPPPEVAARLASPAAGPDLTTPSPAPVTRAGPSVEARGSDDAAQITARAGDVADATVSVGRNQEGTGPRIDSASVTAGSGPSDSGVEGSVTLRARFSGSGPVRITGTAGASVEIPIEDFARLRAQASISSGGDASGRLTLRIEPARLQALGIASLSVFAEGSRRASGEASGSVGIEGRF
jgi:hypothetical protein